LPLVIRSFDESGDIIDENSEDAYVTIADMTSPSEYEITWGNSSANASATTLTLTIYP